MQCLVLCGGYGTRIRSISKGKPKYCIPINNSPFFLYQINSLKKVGIKNFVFLVGNGSFFIKESLKRYLPNLKYKIIDEGIRPRGSAYSILNAYNLGKLEDRFFITYGDSFLQLNKKIVMDAYIDYKKNYVFVLKNNNKWDKSNIRINNKIVIEYKKDKRFKYIDYGISCFSREVIKDYLKNIKEKESLNSIFIRMINDEKIFYKEIHKRFFEIGTVRGYLDTQFFITNSLNKFI
jgi:D-glycero-alpha-D-manno-heptose 1-phosphate guanylyltransferase